MYEVTPGILILVFTIGVIFLIAEIEDGKKQNNRKK